MRFVDFDFRFHLAIGGLLNLPLLPVPLLSPLDLTLEVPHLDNGCAEERDFCFAVLTFCLVFLRHVGQYLFVSLGNFIMC